MEKVLKQKIAIGLISIIGIITTIKLAIIYFNANFNPYALASFCSVNDFIDCDGIAKTIESQFFGIPLAYWGLFLYSFILLLLFADKLKNFKLLKFMEVFKNPFDYIASLGIISFAISMILLCLSLFEIKKLCVLCAFTYILNLFIGCIATDFKNGGFIKSMKQSFIDLIDALKIKHYLIAFLLVMIGAISFLTYTTTTMKFAPQVKQQLEFKEFVKAKKNKYVVRGNLLGDENAKVTIVVYSDYQCPICYAHNIMMHKLAKEMKDVKIIHKNLPLDTDCNPHLGAPFHIGACIDARYVIAAEKQGKLWDMNDILFQHKPQTEEAILDLVKDRNYDLEKLQQDANSYETSQEIKNSIEEAYAKGVFGTPATLINGEAYVGIRKYSQYVEWVKNLGAKKR